MNILIVENDLYMLSYLKKVANISPLINQIDAISCYKDAFNKCFSNNYDLILLDIMLGENEKSGLDLCKIIRKNSSTVPIIIISVKDSIEYIEKAFELGVNDYIAKPFYPKELQYRIKQWLFSHHKLPINNTISYRDLSYDINNNCFHYKKKLLNLTKRNKQLLLIFLKSPGVLISSNLIIEKLWCDYYDNFKNRNLRSNIQVLRKSLEAIEGIKIYTIKGEGYLLK